MQRHLDVTRVRYLPAVTGDGFQLRQGEPLAVGLRRLSVNQCEVAIRGLSDSSGDVDAGIHESRKAMKRLRAVLRLVRPQIGNRVYRYENRTLRDAARLVAGVRDGVVSVETVVALASRFEGSLPVDVFDDLAERLDRRAVRIRERIVHETDAVDRLVSTLDRTRIRFAGWPVDEAERKVYGRAIPDRFRAVGTGLTDTYGRGRLEMKRAFGSPNAHNFHQWRKRAKYLRHQIEILRPWWPEVMGGTAASLERLGDLLGEEHDLAELLGLLSVDPDLCPDPVERSLFAALAQHRRAELQAAARIEGVRLFAEKPERFESRLRAYWDSTRLPIEVGFRLEW